MDGRATLGRMTTELPQALASPGVAGFVGKLGVNLKVDATLEVVEICVQT